MNLFICIRPICSSVAYHVIPFVSLLRKLEYKPTVKISTKPSNPDGTHTARFVRCVMLLILLRVAQRNIKPNKQQIERVRMHLCTCKMRMHNYGVDSAAICMSLMRGFRAKSASLYLL